MPGTFASTYAGSTLCTKPYLLRNNWCSAASVRMAAGVVSPADDHQGLALVKQHIGIAGDDRKRTVVGSNRLLILPLVIKPVPLLYKLLFLF